jgi:hypothetical protein
MARAEEARDRGEVLGRLTTASPSAFSASSRPKETLLFLFVPAKDPSSTGAAFSTTAGFLSSPWLTFCAFPPLSSFCNVSSFSLAILVFSSLASRCWSFASLSNTSACSQSLTISHASLKAFHLREVSFLISFHAECSSFVFSCISWPE